ncbi:MAG: prepilin-type N-terminal cleavage/methylation domain-containing protein [Helicobacteraceae bacterium]|jgi:prepilin-type N-terminal cleavage/methylation domain-containing protein|nr:prepilin-type N-terminal cleavage/methylation domain-containing protein [Helicobacteraceae bacterium]
MRSLIGAFRGGFTLIELLIVLIIIGVIYASATAVIRAKSADSASRWALENLDEAMKNFPQQGYIRLVCGGEKCESCALYDENANALVEDIALFDDMPIVHFFDRTGYLGKRIFPHERCFQMERFENGAISDMLLEHRATFYRYYAFYRQAQIFTGFEDAKRTLDNAVWIPTARNQYFSKDD